MLQDNFRLSYPEATVYWSWKDWLGVNPQEVKVGAAIGVVLARVEGSDPNDWISLPLPTPTHLSRPTGGHQICAWQRLCFCVLWRANGGAVLEKNGVILGRSAVSYWLTHRQLVSETDLKVTWPTCLMAVCFSGLAVSVLPLIHM